MKGEIPMYTKCCGCLPLRYGLIAWGYVKIIVDLLYLWLISNSLVETFTTLRPYEYSSNFSQFNAEVIVSTIGITIFFTDFIVTIMFIIGGHKKNVLLIKIFYFVSMGMWVFTFLLTDAIIVLSVHQLIANEYSSLETIVLVISFYFGVIAAQTYFLILLRSEIIKLKKMDEFRFENKTAEVKCTIKCEEITKEQLAKAHI